MIFRAAGYSASAGKQKGRLPAAPGSAGRAPLIAIGLSSQSDNDQGNSYQLMLALKSRRLEESGLVTRVCVHIVRHALVLISLLVDAGLSFAAAQMKLDATYRATLLGLPIGQMSWTVEIHDNRFESVAKGAISGFLRLFLDVQGEVTAHGALSSGKPVASNFSLQLLAGKWSDDVRIVFSGNKAKEYVAAAPANPSADRVPLTEADRIGAVDPMTALLVHIGGNGATTVPEACKLKRLFYCVFGVTLLCICARILNERMLETIIALGRQALDQHNVGFGEFLQRRLQGCVLHPGHIADQAIGEAAADHRADLRHLARRTEAVEPRHQGLLQRWRNGLDAAADTQVQAAALTTTTMDELRTCLGACPAEMPVETERCVPVDLQTVAELRSLSAWPPGLVLCVPREYDRWSVVRVGADLIHQSRSRKNQAATRLLARRSRVHRRLQAIATRAQRPIPTRSR